MQTIDIHTHVFNLRYLPLSGIIRRYTNGRAPKWAAKGVAKFLLNHTASSFEEQQPLAAPVKMRVPILEQLNKMPPSITLQQKGLHSAYSFFDIRPEALIEGLGHQITPTDLQDEDIKEALFEFTPNQDALQQAFGASRMLLEHSENLIIESEMLLFGQRELQRLLEWVLNMLEDIENNLRWLVFMMNSEEDIFLRLREKDASGVSMFVHLMMDVDHYFKEDDGEEHKSYYDFATAQIQNMLKLQFRYPQLIGFVAVDPSRPDWQEIVDTAIAAGFKGLKFYPPMGYYFGMESDEVIAQRIDKILEYCVAKDLPLFAHCNNSGFQADPKNNSGFKSNPKYWAQALQKYPTLRICLGHAGGGSGWFSRHTDEDINRAEDIDGEMVQDSSEEQLHWNKSYAAQVFKLCALHSNVYCDASYLDEMVETSGELSIVLSDQFRRRLLILFKNNPCFSKKIMYGSDWHMLFREAKQEVYYKSYVEFMSHPDLSSFKEDFFGGNARTYLNMKYAVRRHELISL